MTQWKVGDRAVFTQPRGNYDIGDIVTVEAFDCDGDIVFEEDMSKHIGWAYTHTYLKPYITTYETITINGKLYNLVPVEA